MNVSFSLKENRCLGILGESGSGKSMLWKSLMGLLDENFCIHGEVNFNGCSLLELSKEEKRLIRGKQITTIVQNPMTAFDPLFTLGNQMIETFISHSKLSFKKAKNLSLDDSKTSDVVLHSIEWFKTSFGQIPKNVMLLQPTSPFRSSEDINCAIRKFLNSKKKTLVSVTEVFQHPGDCLVKNLDGKLSRIDLRSNINEDKGRQGFLETFFIDGGIYILKKDMSMIKFFASPTYRLQSLIINKLPKNYERKE